jgi:hypothetical protein
VTDFDDFFELVKRSAATSFKKKGEHLPMFYMWMQGSDTIALSPAGWSDLQDKENKFLVMRAGLELGMMKCVCLVHEMWFKQYDRPDSRVINAADLPPPSTQPDRREMLMIVGVDLHQHRIGTWEIKRTPGKRKPELGPFLIPDDMQPLSAAFRGLTRSDGTAH